MGFLRSTVTYSGKATIAGLSIVVLAISQLLSGCASVLKVDRSLAGRQYDWAMYGGNPGRTNQSVSTLAPPLRPVWEYNAVAGISGSPLVKDSVVVVGTLKGELHGVRFADGEGIGYTVLESAVVGTPVWEGPYLYVATAQGTETLMCIFLREGKREWTAQFGPIETSPLLIGEFLYVTTLDGVLIAVKKADGKEFWRFETGPKGERKPVRSSPASDGEVVAFGSDDGWIYAVERTTGKLRWKYQTGASVFATPVMGEGLCVVGSLDGNLYAIDAHAGTLRWKYETGSKIYASAALSGSMAFIGVSNGEVLSISLESGRKVWSFAAGSVVSCAPLIAGDFLYVGSLDHTLYALRIQTGEKVWEYQVEGRIRVTPVIWGNEMILTYEDKFISALRSTEN